MQEEQQPEVGIGIEGGFPPDIIEGKVETLNQSCSCFRKAYKVRDQDY